MPSYVAAQLPQLCDSHVPSAVRLGLGTPLMGGINLLARANGVGADTIIGARIVLANGSLVGDSSLRTC